MCVIDWRQPSPLPLEFSSKLLWPLSVLGMSACTLAPDLPMPPCTRPTTTKPRRAWPPPTRLRGTTRPGGTDTRIPSWISWDAGGSDRLPDLAAASARLQRAQGYAQQAGALPFRRPA